MQRSSTYQEVTKTSGTYIRKTALAIASAVFLRLETI